MMKDALMKKDNIIEGHMATLEANAEALAVNRAELEQLDAEVGQLRNDVREANLANEGLIISKKEMETTLVAKINSDQGKAAAQVQQRVASQKRVQLELDALKATAAPLAARAKAAEYECHEAKLDLRFYMWIHAGNSPIAQNELALPKNNTVNQKYRDAGAKWRGAPRYVYVVEVGMSLRPFMLFLTPP